MHTKGLAKSELTLENLKLKYSKLSIKEFMFDGSTFGWNEDSNS